MLNLSNLALLEASAAAQPNAAGGLISTVLFMVVMIVVFYFFLIRPQKKKDKAVKDMLDNLKVGDRICTIGGIYGTITGLREDSVELCVGHDDVKMTVARWAIRNVEDVKIENDSEVLN